MAAKVHHMQYIDTALLASGPDALAYRESDKWLIKQHLSGLYDDYMALRPRTIRLNYTGRSERLLELLGTIPINHQGQTYHIPVKVILPRAYPAVAPHIFVDPTPNMQIASGHPNVQAADGRVVTPMLTGWGRLSSLHACIADLCSRFGSAPPVHARSSPAPPPPPGPSYSSPALPGYTNPMHGGPAPMLSHQNDAYPSPYGNAARPSSSTHSPAAAQRYPPMPLATPPAHSGGPSAAAASAAPTPAPAADRTMEQLRDEFRARALDALVTRIDASCKASAQAIGKSVGDLDSTLQQLERRRQALEGACAEKKEELKSIERNVSQMCSTSTLMEGWLQKHEGKIGAVQGELDPEQVIVPADGLCEQAFAAQAEDLAIEDTLAALKDALKTRALPPGVFMKQVRDLAQQQFEARLLLQKVQRARQEQVPHMAGAAPQADWMRPANSVAYR